MDDAVHKTDGELHVSLYIYKSNLSLCAFMQRGINTGESLAVQHNVGFKVIHHPNTSFMMPMVAISTVLKRYHNINKTSLLQHNPLILCPVSPLCSHMSLNIPALMELCFQDSDCTTRRQNPKKQCVSVYL